MSSEPKIEFGGTLLYGLLDLNTAQDPQNVRYAITNDNQAFLYRKGNIERPVPQAVRDACEQGDGKKVAMSFSVKSGNATSIEVMQYLQSAVVKAGIDNSQIARCSDAFLERNGAKGETWYTIAGVSALKGVHECFVAFAHAFTGGVNIDSDYVIAGR
ncbi:MAG: hypothetical protein ABW189_08135 [Rickettsiales bacterium]